MHHPTDRITHTTAFVTPVVEDWLEREIAQWVHPMKDRSDDPSHHERTLLPRSYISLLSAHNRQNDRVYGRRKKDIPVKRLDHETSRFTNKVMVSVRDSRHGKTRIHFIDTNTTKVNSENRIVT